MAKRGRKRLEGKDRYPSGRIKQTNDRLAPTLKRRMYDKLLEECSDPKYGHYLGRLLIDEKLTVTEYTAACKMGEIVGAGDFYMGCRRAAKSPSYESGFNQAARESDNDIRLTAGWGWGDKETTEPATPYEERAINAEQKISFMRDAIERAWPGQKSYYILERLCVDNEPLTSGSLAIAKAMLATLIDYFGTEAAPKKTKVARSAKQKVIKIRPSVQPLRERDHFVSILQRLRPDLESDDYDREYSTFCAFRDRDVFRQTRENRIGAL